MAHALLSASSAARWMACPPSARLTEPMKDKGSDYAREGTLAHMIAENRLHKMLDDINGDAIDDVLEGLKKSMYFENAMLDYVEVYVDTVIEKYHEALTRSADAQLIIEAKLDFSKWVPDGFGTGDAVIIADGKMEIIDLKYGQGVPVRAFGNPQMRLYAAGALLEFGFMYDIHEVVMTIVQPRLDSISSDTLTVEELMEWLENEVGPKAKMAYKGKGEFKAGGHCQFCKAKALCKTRKAAADDLLMYEFKHPNLLTRDEVGSTLVIAKEVAKWAKDLEDYAFEELTHGKEIPGWKLVEGRSNRTITDTDKALEILSAGDYSEDEYLKPRALKGITDLEKAFGKNQLSALIGSLIDKPQGKATMVVESDPRPALNSVHKDFENEDFDL